MSLTDLRVETAGNDIASARSRAIDAFLDQARGLFARHTAGRCLDWQIGLVAQLAREGDVGIRLVAPRATAAS